jgi:hypothetical protein
VSLSAFVIIPPANQLYTNQFVGSVNLTSEEWIAVEDRVKKELPLNAGHESLLHARFSWADRKERRGVLWASPTSSSNPKILCKLRSIDEQST